MFELIGQYIDIELAMLIITTILSFIILNLLFKKVTMNIWLKRIIIICVICLIGFWGYNYIEKEEILYAESISNNYIVGKIQFVSKSLNKINIVYVNSNIPVINKSEIIVNVDAKTKYILKESYNPQVEVSIDELKLGDVVTIYCNENALNKGKKEITARKILKKES